MPAMPPIAAAPRRARLALLGLVLVAALGPAAAPPARAEAPPVSAVQGYAIGGHDVVAYFTEGRPVPGRPEHALKWRGAIWLFSGPDTLARFEMDPKAYAPRFGGYCAWALSQGMLAQGDPAVFAIRDGRLYLAHTAALLALWEADSAARIEAAQAKWPEILKRAAVITSP